MSTLLSLETILAMNEDTLNRAIETEIYKHRWVKYEDAGWGTRYELAKADGHRTCSTMPHLHTTANWDATMALCLRYWITVAAVYNAALDDWTHYTIYLPARSPYEPTAGPALRAVTEHEARVAICRLALFRATQEP